MMLMILITLMEFPPIMHFVEQVFTECIMSLFRKNVEICGEFNRITGGSLPFLAYDNSKRAQVLGLLPSLAVTDISCDLFPHTK